MIQTSAQTGLGQREWDLGVRKPMALQLDSVNAFMFPEMPLQPAAVGVVTGFCALSGYVAAHAADLYHHGYFDRVVVTGGIIAHTAKDAGAVLHRIDDPTLIPPPGLTEAAFMRRVLLDRGVPDGAIVLEDKAQNTGDNFEMTRQALAPYESFFIVPGAAGGPRAAMTARRVWPFDTGRAITFSLAWPLGLTPQTWQNDPFMVNYVLSEWAKIAPEAGQPYVRTGFCAPFSKEKEADAIASRPVQRQAPPKDGLHLSAQHT